MAAWTSSESHQSQIEGYFILKNLLQNIGVAILVFSGVMNSLSEGNFLPSLIQALIFNFNQGITVILNTMD